MRGGNGEEPQEISSTKSTSGGGNTGKMGNKDQGGSGNKRQNPEMARDDSQTRRGWLERETPRPPQKEEERGDGIPSL